MDADRQGDRIEPRLSARADESGYSIDFVSRILTMRPLQRALPSRGAG